VGLTHQAHLFQQSPHIFKKKWKKRERGKMKGRPSLKSSRGSLSVISSLASLEPFISQVLTTGGRGKNKQRSGFPSLKT
jgi:hypothetical protein